MARYRYSIRPQHIRALTALVAILLAAGTLSAGAVAAPEHTDPRWEATYWDNASLAGDPITVRQEDALDHYWGYGSPASGIPVDNFSARWERYIDVTPGTYRFTVTADDGVRLWVDGDLIINQWKDHWLTTYTADKHLGPGHHLIKVEYFERSELAAATVSWSLVPDGSQHWRGEYYSNMTLSGAPALVRDDRVVNFYWGNDSPAPGLVDSDGFSVRWTRNLEMQAGNHRFSITVDDGARLWVNGHLLIDAWKDQPPSTYYGDIYLPGGSTHIQLEYYDNRGSAEALLVLAQPDPVDWKTYSDATFAVELQYPGNWQQVADDRFGGPDGFFMVGAMDSDSIDRAAQAEAYHILQPYGSSPTIQSLLVQGQDARLILPSADQPLGMNDQAALIVRYPQPVQMPGQAVRYFSMYADKGHIGAIEDTLRFTAVPDQPRVVVVDDGDSDCVKQGLDSGWHTAPEPQGGSMTWTKNNDYARDNYNWARWYADLVPGRYEVFAYIPEQYSTTAAARYWVSHQDGYTLRIVDQSANGSEWVSLGTFAFRGTRDDHVSLSDVTYETYLSRLIAFDAMKWEPR